MVTYNFCGMIDMAFRDFCCLAMVELALYLYLCWRKEPIKRHRNIKKKQKINSTKKLLLIMLISLMLISAAIISIDLIRRIMHPDIVSYTGICTQNKSGSFDGYSIYRFVNYDGKSESFVMPPIARRYILRQGFESGKKYIIYFEKGTGIIVAVEQVPLQ